MAGMLPPLDRGWKERPWAERNLFTVVFDIVDFATTLHRYTEFASDAWKLSGTPLGQRSECSATTLNDRSVKPSAQSTVDREPNDFMDRLGAVIDTRALPYGGKPHTRSDYDWRTHEYKPSPLPSLRTRQDFEQYFNTGVCHRALSSFAQMSVRQEPSCSMVEPCESFTSKTHNQVVNNAWKFAEGFKLGTEGLKPMIPWKEWISEGHPGDRNEQAGEATLRHDRLPDAKTYIRLLEVLTARSDASIECKLTYWAVAAAPPYTAISYTWGDPLEVSEIIVNAAKLEVRNNCVQVLRQANHHGSGYYWVDAICVNQLDDQEKSSQVQMMGAIFRKATAVLACVGVHSTADDSAYLCKFLRKHQRTLLDYAQFESIHKVESTLPWFARSAWWRIRHSLKVQTRVLRALFALISRPYFRRAWVAQELFVATEPVMYCDMDTCAVSSIAGLIIISSWNDEKWFSRFASKLHTSSEPGHSWLRERVFASSLRACENLNGLEETVSKLTHNATTVASLAHRNPDRYVDLTNALMNSAFTNAGDPRDKIYACLGMLEPNTRAMIVVDYSFTPFELATGFISVMMNCHERAYEESAWLNDRYMYLLGMTLKIEASDPALLAEIAARVEESPRSIHGHDVSRTPFLARIIDFQASGNVPILRAIDAQ
ncbi:hypothetical protein B0A48_05653 [Cryoendolithus antarcticus]|uniref:Heterokaryon incompatibility domain-containing protein n=1 Tax=Cryoendolithus antarcticus TaxID=1507870 RepID=A0A1V8TBI7_9PEZI|nr:hypothetical protein B0A48_05653 [Cryoendolithus antarcticus]